MSAKKGVGYIGLTQHCGVKEMALPCTLSAICILKPQTPVSQNVSIFGDRIIKKVSKLK